MNGWAFIEDMDSENGEVYIVLKSGSRTYIFDTMVMVRTDITRHFEELNLNLDYSGFAALIPARKIANGEYSVGIYIRKGDIEALIYTNKATIKSKGTMKTERRPGCGVTGCQEGSKKWDVRTGQPRVRESQKANWPLETRDPPPGSFYPFLQTRAWFPTDLVTYSRNVEDNLLHANGSIFCVNRLYLLASYTGH